MIFIRGRSHFLEVAGSKGIFARGTATPKYILYDKCSPNALTGDEGDPPITEDRARSGALPDSVGLAA